MRLAYGRFPIGNSVSSV